MIELKIAFNVNQKRQLKDYIIKVETVLIQLSIPTTFGYI